MPYPSFLWNRPLCGCAEIAPSIPENVLTDLLPEGDFKPASRPFLRCPCSAEEIPGRQGILRLMLKNGDFAGRIESLAARVSEAERLAGRIDRSDTDEEKILLFLPAAEQYFALCGELAELSVYPGKAGEIGRFFRNRIGGERFLTASKRCRDIRSRRASAVKLTVRGNEIRASAGNASLKEELEETFREMRLENAIPAFRHPAAAPPFVTVGYAGVYGGYFGLAREFWREYRDVFRTGDFDWHELYRIGDELAFLLDAAAYFRRLRENGYPLCWPEASEEKRVTLAGLTDPSLLRREVRDPVANDVFMAAEEGGEKLNFFLLTGANGGGKTTFLRSCGLAVLFFLLGFPVTAESGRMYVFDAVYSHFPANESFENSGRFVNEAERANEILEKATADSFVLFNETYSGTDEKMSGEYSTRLARAMYERGTFGIYVTHIHAMTGGEIPTLAAVIDERNGNRRTYKIRRVGGTSSSFARDILEKYGLDKESLAKRPAKREVR